MKDLAWLSLFGNVLPTENQVLKNTRPRLYRELLPVGLPVHYTSRALHYFSGDMSILTVFS